MTCSHLTVGGCVDNNALFLLKRHGLKDFGVIFDLKGLIGLE